MSDITVVQLDEQMKKMVDARNEYDAKKLISNEADAIAQAEKSNMLALLQKCGKTSYSATGLGSVSVIELLKVKMPSDFTEKKKLLDHLAAEGDDVLLNYFTVNYNSLNSYYNTKVTEALELGIIFDLPGVDLPTSEQQLRYRR